MQNQWGMFWIALAALGAAPSAFGEPTYAEKLGWPAGARVLILHNDDAGMSHESNLGTIEGFEKGFLTSCSVMMPCSWVPEFAHYAKEHSSLDIGLHLTMTSEWNQYRWGPVAGRDAVPGLVDDEGYLYKDVRDVITKASADEVDKEIRAQIALAERMGLPITHLDSHMGTLFYNPEFFERYIAIGIEKQIPIMIMSGYGSGTEDRGSGLQELVRIAAQKAWDGGLPVLDDLKTSTADTDDPAEMIQTLIANLKALQPGVTQIILHGTRPDENWRAISSSGGKREAELEMVLSPEVRKVIEEEGIILTTWKELKQRRDAVGG